MLLFLDRPVAAEDPDDIILRIASGKLLAKYARILRRENLGPLSAEAIVLVAPGWKKSHDNPERVRLRDHPVHMLKIILLRLGWIIIRERCVPVRIWIAQPVLLGQHDGLDRGETFFRTVL